MSDTVTTFSESSSNSPGAVLKRCREFHKLSLEDASETTKIGVSYLKALEDDRVGEFANLTYLKGFLRIYATYLGLNSDDMARMYDKLDSAKNEENNVNTPTRFTPPLCRMATLKKLVLPVFLLLLILVVALFFKRPPEPPLRPAQPTALPLAVEPVVPVQPVISSAMAKPVTPSETAVKPVEIESKSLLSETEEKKVVPKYKEDAARSFILKVKVSQNGTLIATVDGSAPQNYELTAGDVIEWKAEKSITLDVGNEGVIDLELNGKPYKQLGSEGKPAYLELDAERIQQIHE